MAELNQRIEEIEKLLDRALEDKMEFEAQLKELKELRAKHERENAKIISEVVAEDKGRDWNQAAKNFQVEGASKDSVRIIGEASCGCFWTLDLKVEEGFITFRQAFDLYGSQFVFGRHDTEHADQCLAKLPPDILTKARVSFESPMKLQDLL